MELNIETINNHKMGGRVNIHFSKTDLKMAKRHIKDVQHHSLLEKCRAKFTMRWGITSHQSERPS